MESCTSPGVCAMMSSLCERAREWSASASSFHLTSVSPLCERARFRALVILPTPQQEIKPPMARFKLVSNVSEYGLFRSLARTRSRLIVSALVATAAMIGAGLLSTHYIIEVSTSVGLNIVIITALMMIVMVSSYLQAMVIGDLCFKGPWRQQVILGEKPWKEDLEAQIVVTNHNAEFMVALIALVIGNALLLNYSGGGFLDRYHDEGFFLVRMRSEDPEERLAALRDMSDPMQSPLWENPRLGELVEKTLEQDSSPEVLAQAAWNAGVMDLKASRAELLALLEDRAQKTPVREEAAVALGRLGPNEAAREAMEGALSEGIRSGDEALQIAMLRGLGTLAMRDSAGALLELVEQTLKPDDDREELMAYALWALHHTQAPEARALIKERLSDETPEQGVRLCALLDAMKMLSTPRDVSWARKEFMRVKEDTACERLAWQERDERLHTIVFSDTLRTKYVKIVANSGEGTRHRSWFETIAQDEQQAWSLREVASAFVKQIDKIGSLH